MSDTPKTEEKEAPKKTHVSTLSKLRVSSKFRLGVIIVLMIIVAIMFYFWTKARIALAVVFITLLAALGLEVSGNDWDLGKLMKTGSLQESKVQKSENGNWLISDECKKEKLNCDNFTYQEEAQDLFEYCGGKTNDIHGLDRDKDGIVCESLPKKNK